MSTRCDRATALILVLAAALACVPAPEPPPAPAAPAVRSSEPSPAPDARALLDQIAGCVDSGKLNVEIDLQAGRVPAAPGWITEVIGTGKATLLADAVEGRVRRLAVAITEG
jgi:hypothetical protein